MSAQRILLIGATGVFGRHLAQHLAQIGGIELIVASRDIAKAKALTAELTARQCRAEVTPVALDTSRDIEGQLAELKAWLIIDASGPFQGASYSTARAAIIAGSHWIDLADARDYILGFAQALDGLARANGVCALTGASSTPALSSAVVESLTAGWQRVDCIDIAICPGGRGQVGPSVIRAILSYVGQPIAIFDEGRALTATGWGNPVHRHIDGLGDRYLSRVETADGELLQRRFNVTTRIDFRAGLESWAEHFGLAAISFLRARAWLANPARLTPWLVRARRITALAASDTGAMTVAVSGLDEAGKCAEGRWSLLARQGDGPKVPILPALALTRQLLACPAAPGARPASGEIKLSAIEAEMAKLAISTAQSKKANATTPLFERVLGSTSFNALAPALKTFHSDNAMPVWHGRAAITSPDNLIARTVRRIIGFPVSSPDAAVVVRVERQPDSEIWNRNIADHAFRSKLSFNPGPSITEQFGLFRFDLGILAEAGELLMPVTRWRLGILPLPRLLAPISQTREYEDDAGKFHFDVRISMPFAGLITHYQGWLVPGPEK